MGEQITRVHGIPYFFDQSCSYYSRAAFISSESLHADINGGWTKYMRPIQWQLLDDVCQYAQLPNPAASCGNQLYNTDRPSASPLTSSEIIRIRVPHTVVATIWGWCLFRSELPIVWRLFKNYRSCFSSHYEIVDDIPHQYIQLLGRAWVSLTL